MDPAGIRELYLLRPYTRNPYQVEFACRGLPYKTRVHPVFSINPWLPLSEPLPQRVSRRSEGYAGWLQYDCAVLAGTDLQSASERDVRNVRSAVEAVRPLGVDVASGVEAEPRKKDYRKLECFIRNAKEG